MDANSHTPKQYWYCRYHPFSLDESDTGDKSIKVFILGMRSVFWICIENLYVGI